MSDFPGGHSPDGSNPDDIEQWRELLSSMLGPEGAEEALRALESSGMDLSSLDASALGNPAMLQAAIAQMQQLLGADDDGASQWRFAQDVARQVAHTGGDPTVTAAIAEKARSALLVADLWVDAATNLPPAGGPSIAAARIEWTDAALPILRAAADPVAESVAAALAQMLGESLPEGDGPGGMDVSAMMRNLGKLGFAMQVGQAAGALAREAVSATDIGLPILDTGRMLVPANIADFTKDLDVPEDEVWHFLAVRETAHARLYKHVPWLRAHLQGAVEQYARGIEIDVGQLEDAIRDIDPTDMDQLRSALGGGIFASHRTESQQRALDRLETMLALVEGWVEEVTATAVAAHLPHAVGLRELLRRRRAAGGPAEDTFRTVVGLELRPRKAREAATLWHALAQDRGTAERDQLWDQLDLMPTADDLSDPVAFIAGATVDGEESDFTDLDAELAKILGSADDTAAAIDEPGSPDEAAKSDESNDPDDPEGQDETGASGTTGNSGNSGN